MNDYWHVSEPDVPHVLVCGSCFSKMQRLCYALRKQAHGSFLDYSTNWLFLNNIPNSPIQAACQILCLVSASNK